MRAGKSRTVLAYKRFCLSYNLFASVYPIRMNILIAEDDIIPRRILQAILERQGHTLFVASDGETAWDLYQRHGAEVILSDWMMPGMDGLELCRRVRAASEGRPGEPYTYFVLLTAFGDRTHFLEGMQAGADDYLVKPFDPSHLEARLLVAERVTRLHQDLRDLNRKLWDLARRDALTGLYNRLQLREDLASMRDLVDRRGTPWTVALCDVDYFKRYNDRYGHLAGDEALRRVADVLRDVRTGINPGKKEVGSSAMAYRYGGEEFCLLLNVPLESAHTVLDQVRIRVRDCGIPHADNACGVVTISVGLASVMPGDGSGTEIALKAADQALYLAKERGRDRVVTETHFAVTNQTGR